jgi:hypothetical protein
MAPAQRPTRIRRASWSAEAIATAKSRRRIDPKLTRADDAAVNDGLTPSRRGRRRGAIASAPDRPRRRSRSKDRPVSRKSMAQRFFQTPDEDGPEEERR